MLNTHTSISFFALALIAGAFLLRVIYLRHASLRAAVIRTLALR